MPNLFYRVCPVNDIATPVIVDENGEVCYVNHDGDISVLKYNVATGVITEDATDAVMTACESFTGGSFELELSTDASGYTVYTNGDYHIAIDQSGNIVEGEVTLFNSVGTIGIEGVIQVFADKDCSRYAEGNEERVYIRVNRAFGINDQMEWGQNLEAAKRAHVYTPSTQYPDDPYEVQVWVDWNAGSAGPIASGTVFNAGNSSETTVASPQVIFS